ncbi:hypothetical protein EV385_2443 [Krasilnikovia cinnamomea]|uniref:Ig-like domain-containing protein n=1 Tax=Krasilnikovia cinnamomea TaxID=349313 RepID=A0A4V2G700_9ACTN|nr:hypothetical protein [Krasilnikovia cinnamomea]RZU50666.1 hypothetical protein EV385_2443 [Krasilnikovia cinnamomea]
MTQEPRDNSPAEGAHPGHPQPEPVPLPDPEPPQPIPLPEPLPPPEPPHAADDSTAVPPPWPPVPAAPVPATPGPTGGPRASIAAAEAFPGEADTPGPAPAHPAEGADFIDALPPRSQREWPPPGAYPGEPGHPGSPTELIPGAAAAGDDEPTSILPPQPDADVTEQFQPVAHQQTAAWQQPAGPAAGFPSGLAEQPTEPVGAGASPPGPPPARRTGVWVSAALAATLLFCGGGAVSAYLLLRNADRGKGAPDPATAVDRFLTAVYTEQDATAADGLICREARNAKRLAARVEQIKGYSAEYASPTFSWSEPAIGTHNEDLATVSVQLTMATADEKTAQQGLTFTVVHKTGWLVCDVRG